MTIGDKIKGFFLNHGQKLLNITTGVSGIYCIEQLCEGKYMNAAYAGVAATVATTIVFWMNSILTMEKRIKQITGRKLEDNSHLIKEIREIKENIHSRFYKMIDSLNKTESEPIISENLDIHISEFLNQDYRTKYNLLPKKILQLKDLTELINDDEKLASYGIKH